MCWLRANRGPNVGTIRSMPLASGQTFAGYRVISLLGSGGMGEVYLAQHPRLPRRDALKLLLHDWSAGAEYRARFNRETDLASTLWHPSSSVCTTGVRRTDNCGSRWTSSAGSTQPVSWPIHIRLECRSRKLLASSRQSLARWTTRGLRISL